MFIRFLILQLITSILKIIPELSRSITSDDVFDMMIVSGGGKLMYKEYFERLLRQLSLDDNCTPEDLRAKENRITVPALKEGRRSYSPGMPFLQMVTLGGNTVMMADERLHGFLRHMIGDTEGHRLFEIGSLMKLNRKRHWLSAWG